MKIELDWVAYYEQFCAVHGTCPVLWNNTMLFPDGWRYTFQGQEISPGDDAKQLIRTYWQIRYKILRDECLSLKHDILELFHIQRTRSAPLMMKSQVVDEDAVSYTSVQVNFVELVEQYKLLLEGMAECKRHLEEDDISVVTESCDVVDVIGMLESVEHECDMC